MRANVDELMTMWQTAASNPQLREECQKRTDALAKKLAKTGNEKKLRTVAVKLLKAITPKMEATLIAWMSGDMAAKGVRGFEMQSNSYYSIKRLASSIFGEKTDRAHTEIQFCADKLGQVMKQAWQVQEFPSLKQARTWFDQLPPGLLPNLQYFSKNEWLDKACLHQGYQRQMINAVNASQITMAILGIISSAALKAFVKLYGRQLTALDLSSCPFVNDRDLDVIISYVPSLQTLSLANLSNLSEASIQRLAKKYPSLATLQLDATEVSDETLKLFANPNLSNLSLIRCEEISDAALTFLAATCPKLRTLKLVSIPIN